MVEEARKIAMKNLNFDIIFYHIYLKGFWGFGVLGFWGLGFRV
jgi:hypothetical protein